MIRKIIASLLLLISSLQFFSCACRIESHNEFLKVDKLLNSAIEDSVFPGAAVTHPWLY